MLTFKNATASYSRLLEQQPGKALRIDRDNIAFMLHGSLVGFCDADGVLDPELIYDSMLIRGKNARSMVKAWRPSCARL
ncbi:hypothetical protein ACSQQ9_005451 [Pseudomonas aeruginosa]|uniref:hypothetical protein n=1 Tax=Pseudomonas aeruginosa TaxID=287 RepID=UPI000B418D1B|nr:hypothetical protein [Pseudomonas aeruginosa]ELQ8272699.1 hypothetical protein [Pseudomonas aeruginosa]MBF3052848.1 hypothetical protein [Pseudomonas aeruginosa]MBH3894022.1 hypothetical protein [Pseudomonas aeruginosa]MBH3917231.1 hypothetical protein [Pseudomonas aeruginosa]MBH9015116.1 hypothetical protein [Pseudomonas aeruginosa]